MEYKTDNYFVKEKMSIYRISNSFKIKYANSQFRIKIENVISPFGTEYYNNKKILNILLDTTNNNHNNYIAIVKNIDDAVSNSNCISNNNRQMYFSSSLKKSNKNFIHRCHLSNRNDWNVDINSIQNKKLTLDIHIDKIWVNSDMYGIVWIVHDIYLV